MSNKYRQVQVSFWQDAFVLDLTPEEKYFYIYLMTNSKASQIGVYELPMRIMEMETGYNRETVEKLINRFIEYEKIDYHEPTREIILFNWAKHNWNNSPKVVARVEKELAEIKHIPFVEKYLTIVNSIKSDDVSIQYQYPINEGENGNKTSEMQENVGDEDENSANNSDSDEDPENADIPTFDTVIIPYPYGMDTKDKDKDKDKEKENKDIPDNRIRDLFNHYLSKSIIQHQKMTSAMKTATKARLKDYSYEQLIQAIDNYAVVYQGDEYWFNTKYGFADLMRDKDVRKFIDDAEPLNNFLDGSYKKHGEGLREYRGRNAAGYGTGTSYEQQIREAELGNRVFGRRV